MFKSFTEKAGTKIRHGTVIQYLLYKLRQIGLSLDPYFLEREFYLPVSDLKMNIEPKIKSLTMSFLEPQEINSVFEHPERDAAKESYKIHDRILDGCLCFAVKHGQEIIAYTWCDLKCCNHKPLHFKLKQTEAYLFDMYTFKSYRGKNVAPFMRHQLYFHLNKMGRTDFFSVTNAFNNPSIRFKRKLGAYPSKLYLTIKLGKFFKRNLLLKSYS
jgi:hypothetical protein